MSEYNLVTPLKRPRRGKGKEVQRSRPTTALLERTAVNDPGASRKLENYADTTYNAPVTGDYKTAVVTASSRTGAH
jgi:hypothetical protein